MESLINLLINKSTCFIHTVNDIININTDKKNIFAKISKRNFVKLLLLIMSPTVCIKQVDIFFYTFCKLLKALFSLLASITVV